MSPATRVVHVREQPFDVYIGRATAEFVASIWANQHHIGKDGSREEVVHAYYLDLQRNPTLLARLPELKGKVLGCWCKTKKSPDTLCHGDVLAALADGLPWPRMTAPAQGELF